ncbi:MAG: T9SS type A sorting domain-containing protein [Vicingaceae bacterium]|nr:T9SS type A sorting domain-containing protein [Vicingaceae bacterium]
MKKVFIVILSCFLTNGLAAQYSPPAGQLGSTAIHKDSSVFVGWATKSIIERGWQNIANISAGKTTAGDSISPTGKSGINGVVSLGDNGSAILTFDGVIKDGPGADFAVFENSFDGLFLELAFVEVSSDGINFFRFDAVSLSDTTIQTNSFGNTDATKIYNLAGKYKVQYGTPFDLSELTGTPGLDINNISHVKVVDVVGNIVEPYATFDSQNHSVNDPWPTEFAAGGFDLDAVGVINFNPTSVDGLTGETNLIMYPNPVKGLLTIRFTETATYFIDIHDLTGKVMFSNTTTKKEHSIELNYLKPGVYFVSIKSGTKNIVKRIIKQ